MAATAAFAFAVCSSEIVAQPTEPIYVQYDGFVRNSDGGYVLSFGYFNMNSSDVTIQPGAANAFAPAPPDRNQPVVFLKGRHRFACSMVVDKTFSGTLQWTVAFAGKTSTSTAKALNPLYELELNSQKRALQGLDLTAAPKNVCINRAPHIGVVTSPFEAPKTGDVELPARVDQELAITAQVEDDGLPRGSKVTSAWKKIAGPGDATFSSTTSAATRVKFSAPGVYELELSASDGEKTERTKVTIRVEK